MLETEGINKVASCGELDSAQSQHLQEPLTLGCQGSGSGSGKLRIRVFPSLLVMQMPYR